MRGGGHLIGNSADQVVCPQKQRHGVVCTRPSVNEYNGNRWDPTWSCVLADTKNAFNVFFLLRMSCVYQLCVRVADYNNVGMCSWWAAARQAPRLFLEEPRPPDLPWEVEKRSKFHSKFGILN